ncbi:hypothetical protein SPURM210S_07911 [Streptomyces purpurascens]
MARRRQRLADRRRAVGLTQEALAEKLGVDRSTVVRWEMGAASPQPWMRPRLADALQVSVAVLVDLLGDENEVTSGRQRGRKVVPFDTVKADLTTAADLRHAFDELAARYDQAPSASLLAKGGEHLSLITYMARRASYGRVERELLGLQADALTLMGQLVWDASQRRDHTTARGYYDESVQVARRLRDHTLEGRALLRTCYVALYGAQDPRERSGPGPPSRGDCAIHQPSRDRPRTAARRRSARHAR